jgi:hypothetical protein
VSTSGSYVAAWSDYGGDGDGWGISARQYDLPIGVPTVSVEAVDPTALEGGSTTTGAFRLTRTGDLSQPLTAYFDILGTATNGVDYQPITGQVYFSFGQDSAVIRVTPIDDALPETRETVVLHLTDSPQGSYQLNSGQSEATVSIVDDEADLPIVTIEATDPDATRLLDWGVVTVRIDHPLAYDLPVTLVGVNNDAYGYAHWVKGGFLYQGQTGDYTLPISPVILAGATEVSVPVVAFGNPFSYDYTSKAV